MANKAPASGIQGALQRGKACLRCRKRKMRCDGNKPACQQCCRAKKAEACEYDDGKGKTRTQLLRENILRLEQRIRELEDPEYVSPSVTLYDPHAHSRSASSSSFGSPAEQAVGGVQSPFPSESPTSSNGSWSQLQSIASPSPSPFIPDIFFEDQQARFQPPYELARTLLDIFLPHRRQCGLDVHVGRLLDSLTLPVEDQRHPSLMNAIYTWACFISRPEPLCQHEDHYLNLALDALREGLKLGEKLVDVVQASCLLSMYYLANGRILEGSYHASAAAALAVQCGLHLNIPFEEAARFLNNGEDLDLKPMRTGVKEGERVLAFWQVYNLDRCWSVVLRKPSIIPDGLDSRQTINCPWPQDMAEYEAGHIETCSSDILKSFLGGEVSSCGFSVQALRAKSSALFARADELSTYWNSRSKASVVGVPENVRTLETVISQFMTTLIPLNQLDAVMFEDKHCLIVAHTLAHTASIQLYRPFVDTDPVMFGKCAQAARACASVIKHINDRDYDYLDPIIGPCWSFAADTLIMELDRQGRSWSAANGDMQHHLTTILFAMTTLSPRIPIVALAASKIQKRLGDYSF